MNKLLVSIFILLLWGNLCTAQITIQNDSLFFNQKRMFEQLGVFEAWKVTKGNPRIVIGCIETGFDFYHPYLRDQLVPGYYAEGVYHTETYETVAHGTLVSSLIVANPKNENGMHGLAPDCKVLTASLGVIENPRLRIWQEIMNNNPGMSTIDAMKEAHKEMSKDTVTAQRFNKQWKDFTSTTISNSVTYLVQKGVKVINISLYTFSTDPEFREKVDEVLEYARKHDVLLVMGAGNGNKEIPDVLMNRDNIIVVGASDRNDTRWTMKIGDITQGSNWGEVLDVCAPIEKLAVCMPSDSRFYKTKDGPMGAESVSWEGDCRILRYGATSCATPIVTSLAALIYSIAPHMTAKEVKQAILAGCDDIGDEGIDIYTGHGRINFKKTLSLVCNGK